MSTDFEHPLVGRKVVYTAWHPGARPEEGVVTSVNEEANIVFVRYGADYHSKATTADDRLTTLGGRTITLRHP